MKLIPIVYNVYAMVMGMTSYAVIGGKFKQTRFSQAYAVVMNAITLILLPIGLWKSAREMESAPWLPSYMWMLPYVLYSCNYAAVAYTLIMRCFRDAMLIDLQLVVEQINREISRSGNHINSKLCQFFYLKSFTVGYVCASYIVSVFIFAQKLSLHHQIAGFLVNTFLNILVASTYLYFVSFWQIARGYDFVNQQLEEIFTTQRTNSKARAKQLQSLWALHASLKRTAQMINRHYGLQMLAARFDFCMFSILNGYMGSIYAHSNQASAMEKLFGAVLHCTRAADFFLNDYICDIVTEYQNKPKYFVTEGNTCKELTVYLIYESSSTSTFMVCGLYPANRNKWLKMMASIVVHIMLLLQFDMVMSQK
ncbi:putative gustatory receptor 59b [Drosophila ficusphila]|uniref:putative gustatory receptor 59b n=1 Tax=Drosophila ficusphila TaxID=30025 RepID=UPI0007E83FFB|nr:putative gustatory receptor 59b [Drosophila ficusphila]